MSAPIVVGVAVGGGLWLGLASLQRRGRLRIRALFLGLIGVGLACRIAFVIGTPIFYAPDEEPHFKYIRYLSEHRALPIQTSRTGDPSNDWEYHHPPLYYTAMLPVYAVAEGIFHNQATTARMIRFCSVLFWLCNVWLALRFLRYLEINDDVLKTVVLALICLLPTYLFLSSVINNDNLLITLGGAILCLAVRRRRSLGISILMGVLLGAALLTKLSGALYVPLLLAMSGFEIHERPAGWRGSLARLGLTLGVACAMWSPWAIRNWQLYHSITAGNVAHVPSTKGVFAALPFSVFHTVRTFWSVSGIYNNVAGWLPLIGFLLSMLALGGLLVGTKATAGWAGLPIARNRASLLALAVGIVVNLSAALRFGALYGQAQGRFLFPMLLPIALLFAAGLHGYRMKNTHVHVAGALICYALAFVCYSLGKFAELPG